VFWRHRNVAVHGQVCVCVSVRTARQPPQQGSRDKAAAACGTGPTPQLLPNSFVIGILSVSANLWKFLFVEIVVADNQENWGCWR
jgi:hypothetical protein